MADEFSDFTQPPRSRITVHPLAERPPVPDDEPGNAGNQLYPLTSPYEATEPPQDFNPWERAAARIRQSNVGKLPTPELDWSAVPREFMRGAAESGYGALRSLYETMEGRYYPEDLATHPEKYSITDSGDFILKETGEVLPRQHKPFVVPATREPQTGEIQPAMPGALDIPLVGTPAKGAATLGAGLTRPPIRPPQPPPGIGHNMGPPLTPTPPAPPAVPPTVPPPPAVAPPPIGPTRPRQIIRGLDEGKPFTWGDLYTKVIDDLHPLKVLQNKIAEHGALSPDEMGYELARLTRGSHGRTQQALDNATFDFHTLQNNGMPLKEALKPVRNNLDAFEDYAVAMRDIELLNRGINPGTSHAEAMAKIANAPPEFRTALRNVHAFQDRNLQYLADSGFLSPDALDSIRRANRQYVPFYRLMDNQMNDIISSPRNVKAWDPIKKIIGSERDILSPLESIVRNTHKFIDLAEKNRALTALVDAAERRGLTGLVERIHHPRGQRPSDDEIKIWRNGNPEFYRVDPDVAQAVNGMGRQEVDMVMKLISMPSRTLRAGATLNFEFLLRNLTKDQLQAAMFSKNTYLPYIDYLRGLGHMMAKSEHYQNWLKSGGANSNFVTLERNYVRDQLQNMRETGWYDKIMQNARPIKFLEKMSEYSEQPTRIGEFVKSQKRGKTIHQSGFESKEVTVDFSKHGASQVVRSLSHSTAFFNPTIQGQDRLARAFIDNPYKTSFMVAAYITLPTLLTYAYNRQDPRMRDIPRQERDTFWHYPTDDWQPISKEDLARFGKHGVPGIPAKDWNNWIKTINGQTYINQGTIYKAPKPHEPGVVFGSSIERVLDAYFMEHPDAFKGFLKSLGSAALPSMLPQALLAPVESWSNYSFFREAPLVSKRISSPKARQYEYTPFTTETAKFVGNAIAQIAPESQFASPVVLENYLNGWFGPLGRYTVQIVDAAAEGGARLGAKIAGKERKPKVSPEWSEADYPGWRAFVSRLPSTTAQPIRDFYENIESSTTIKALMSRMAKSNEFETEEQRRATQSDITRNLFPVKMAKTGIAVNRMFRVMELVIQNRDIEAKDKRRMIDMLSINIMYATSEANKMFRSAQEQNRNIRPQP